MKTKTPPKFIKAIINEYPTGIQRKILELRTLIYKTANDTEGCGQILESLKWNEPSYATRPKTGAPIRLAWHAKRPDEFGLYVPCQTSLIRSFKNKYPKKFTYDGTRGIIFSKSDDVSDKAVKDFMQMALTYYKK